MTDLVQSSHPMAVPFLDDLALFLAWLRRSPHWTQNFTNVMVCPYQVRNAHGSQRALRPYRIILTRSGPSRRRKPKPGRHDSQWDAVWRPAGDYQFQPAGMSASPGTRSPAFTGNDLMFFQRTAKAGFWDDHRLRGNPDYQQCFEGWIELYSELPAFIDWRESFGTAVESVAIHRDHSGPWVDLMEPRRQPFGGGFYYHAEPWHLTEVSDLDPSFAATLGPTDIWQGASGIVLIRMHAGDPSFWQADDS